MSEDDRGNGVVDVLLACTMDAATKPTRGRFDSEIGSRGKAGPGPDVGDDVVAPS